MPRILCVDDEPSLRDMLALYLRHQGFHVETAGDGLAAWDAISANPAKFDVVITDNQMPQMTGLELVEKLRHSKFPGHILFFSSTLTYPNVEYLELLGVDAVVEKGRPITEFLAALHRTLNPA
jgi:two-component system, OmpR family, response regulator